jgi:hypothetical protein
MNMTVIEGVDSEASKASLRLAAEEARCRSSPLPGESAVPGTVSLYVLLKARCPVTIGPDESTEEKASSGDS